MPVFIRGGSRVLKTDQIAIIPEYTAYGRPEGINSAALIVIVVENTGSEKTKLMF
jgi:hypothetical protein